MAGSDPNYFTICCTLCLRFFAFFFSFFFPYLSFRCFSSLLDSFLILFYSIIGFQLRVAPPSGETVASEETAAESAFGGERKQSMMKSKLRANLSKSMSLDKPSMESEEGILLAGGETIG